MEELNEEPGGNSIVICSWALEEAGVELAIRIALMFFFIQFVVLMMVMAAALLRARPEVPTLGLTVHRSLNRTAASVTKAPWSGLRSIVQKAQSIRLRGVR
jgi:hypothetical protein